MKPIFLIGLPGSGKSIFGKSLAAALDLNHVDLDQVIESKTNKSIDALFEIHGEAYFREIEKKMPCKSYSKNPVLTFSHVEEVPLAFMII